MNPPKPKFEIEGEGRTVGRLASEREMRGLTSMAWERAARPRILTGVLAWEVGLRLAQQLSPTYWYYY